MSSIKPEFWLTVLTYIQTEEIYSNDKNRSHFFNKKYLIYVYIYFYMCSNINFNAYSNVFLNIE